MKKAQTELTSCQDAPLDDSEKREARILFGCIALSLAFSLGAWFLSIKFVGYWWTVLLAELLGR